MTFSLINKPIELLFFSSALVGLFFLDVSQHHFSFCPLASLGFKFCPGCGLGHSLYYLMHFQFQHSWEAHPLSFFAFFVIIHRIYTLSKKQLNQLH
jgi:hypothetical protein